MRRIFFGIASVTVVLWPILCDSSGHTFAQTQAPGAIDRRVTAIKAGRLVNTETGNATTNQTILVEGETITAVGSNISIPRDAIVIDLSKMTVLPGMVDAHHHLSMSLSYDPRSSLYEYYLQTDMPTRALYAAANAVDMLASGFTVIRDLGNEGNYVVSALRKAIESGWLPGPTIVNAGIIIAPTGGQFRPTPELWKDKNIVYPEYLEADTRAEMVKAIRQNVMFGAKVIKLVTDQEPYAYTVDDLKFIIAEAAKSGLHVAAHVGSVAGAERAIEAGVWSIEHANGLNDANHKKMAAKGIWRAGTEMPFREWKMHPEANLTLDAASPASRVAFERTVAGIKNAYENKVLMAFSTDGDANPPHMSRGEYILGHLMPWKASGLPNAEILKILTTNGHKIAEVDKERGAIKPGLAADLIATTGNPLDNLDALKDVQFVMKDGVIFKQNGVVTPWMFFRGGHRSPPVRRGTS